MGRKGLNYEQVAHAAEVVFSRGDTPTVARIRTVLGDTGSSSTLCKYLNEWKNEKLSMKSASTYVPPDPVNRAVENVWKTLQDENTRQITELKVHYGSQLNELKLKLSCAEEERINTNEECHRLTQIQQQLYKDLQSAKEETEQARQHEKEAKLFSERSQVELDALRLSLENKLTLVMEQHQQYAKDLVQQLSDISLNHQQETNELRHLMEDKRHTYIIDIDQLKVANNQLTFTNTQSQNEIEQLKASITLINSNLALYEKKYKTLEQENNSLHTQLAIANHQLDSKEDMITLYKLKLAHDVKHDNHFKKIERIISDLEKNTNKHIDSQYLKFAKLIEEKACDNE